MIIFIYTFIKVVIVFINGNFLKFFTITHSLNKIHMVQQNAQCENVIFKSIFRKIQKSKFMKYQVTIGSRNLTITLQ